MRCPALAVSSLLAAALLVAAPAGPARAADEAEVTVRGVGVALGETPVNVDVSAAGLEPSAYTMTGGGATLAGQVYDDGDRTFLAFVLPGLGPDAERRYRLTLREKPAPEGVRIEPDGRDLRVLIDGEPFTVYRADDGPKPYFYPVIGPTGAPITRAYPMADVEGEDRDHPHQRSFWFTHGDVNGVDFWASDPLNKPNPRFGRIEEASRPAVVDGPVVGLIRTTDRWLDPDGKTLCTDDRSWRTYDTEGVRVVDLDVTMTATDGPVTFGDTKEGSFGLRLASSMNVNRKSGGRIVNAEGITDIDAWGKASSWVDYSGPVHDETVGVAILNHPESFRYPTTWHVRDYGLFAANPFGYDDFKYKDAPGNYTIPAGESIRFRYRVILHLGDTEAAGIPAAFTAYAEGPAVEVRPVE